MKRYWDLTKKERANLTGEEVTALLPYELMEAGVVPPATPVYEDETPVAVPTRRMFVVTIDRIYDLDAVFEYAADAQEVADLVHFKVHTDYPTNTKYFTPCEEVVVKSVELATKDDVENVQVRLTAKRKIHEKNEQARREYTEKMKAVEEVTSRVWDDVDECRAEKARVERVCKTLDEYVELTGGDHDLAERFLAKAFPAEEIAVAREWFPERWPTT